MARKVDRFDPEDDGRTIADMNVDGMPWYVRDRKENPDADTGTHYQMSKEESRMYTWAAVTAGLVIVLIFAGVFAAFIAFLDFIWFA